MNFNDLFQQYKKNLSTYKRNNETFQLKNDFLIKHFIENFSNTNDELYFILEYKDTHPLLKRFSKDFFLEHHLKFLDYNDVENNTSTPLLSIILDDYFVFGENEILFFNRLFDLLPKTTIKLHNNDIKASYMMINTYNEDYQENGVLIIKSSDMFKVIYNRENYYKDENKIIELIEWKDDLFNAVEEVKPKFFLFEL